MLRDGKLFVAKRCSRLIDELNNYHWRKWDEDKDSNRSEPFKLGEDLCDALRYAIHSRPDYFEHPRVNQYGLLEPEPLEEEESLDEVDMSDRVDDLMSGRDLF